jgi:hypothetical protein
MKKILKIMLYVAAGVSAAWLILTLVVERPGPSKSWDLGDVGSSQRVLIVYDPDPFYNLDEQICLSFAKGLAAHGLAVKVASVSAAKELKSSTFTAFVFCANTYNWSPDWAVSDFISQQPSLDNKPVVAITLGAGSTDWSQKRLEQLIINNRGKILDSRPLWLLRPNDEARMKESNIKVACAMVQNWADTLSNDLLTQ